MKPLRTVARYVGDHAADLLATLALLLALSLGLTLAAPVLAETAAPVPHATAQDTGTQGPGTQDPGTLVSPAPQGPIGVAAQDAGGVLTYQRLKALSQGADPTKAERQALIANAMSEHDLLALAWAIALALSVAIYLVLDGADLGAGIISLFYDEDHTKGAIMSSMAGTWDANETWLVVAGGILFGGFPFVYGTVFHYLMAPLIVLLIGIMLRAVALEFHHHAERSQRAWGLTFGISSLVLAFVVGAAGGAVMDGVPLTARTVTYGGGGTVQVYTGGLFGFVSTFSLWTGVVGVIAAAFGGALYLRARFVLDSPLRAQMKPWVTRGFLALLAVMAVTALWFALRFPWAADKWLGAWWPAWGLGFLWVGYSLWKIHEATHHDRDLAAMAWYAVMTMSVLGLMALTIYPWLVPGTWTIQDGADPTMSMVDFTVAMGGFIPVILVYNWYQIWVFRDRISSLGTYAAE